MRPSPKTLLVLAGALAAGVLAASTIGPHPPRLGPERTGDPALAARTLDALGGAQGHRGVAVAWVEDGEVTTAGLGTTGRAGEPVGADTPFETGSVAKALTGVLLADAVDRGEVRLDEPVGALVPGTALAGSGTATLAEVATHRSGLPRLDPSPLATGRAALAGLTAGTPYSGGADDVLAAAGGAGAPGGADPEYSNLGFAALGDALAVRAGTTYEQLLAQRLTGPLGMTATTVAADPSEVPAGAARPVAGNGREQDPWTAPGWAPAGVGPHSTAADLGALAAALLDGTAPGASALDPVAPYEGARQIGLAWITDPADPGRGLPPVTWHDGGTGGTRAYVGLDREGGRAVVLLATGSRGVEAAGEALLAEVAGGQP